MKESNTRQILTDMPEELISATEKSIQQTVPETPKPSFWQNALRSIKGESTENLIEQFTGEMTLVAEGLCEDQSRVNRTLTALEERVSKLDDRSVQNLDRAVTELKSEIETIETDMDSARAEIEKRLTAIESRLNAIDKKLETAEKKGKGRDGIIRQATILAAILCGSWVAVTLLQLIRTAIH